MEPASREPGGATFRPFGTLVGGATIMPPLGGLLVLGTLDMVGPWLAQRPVIGVTLYIVGFIIMAGLALLPTYAQAILGGWAFGFAIGFPAAMLGFLGAALLAHSVVQRTAHDAVLAIDLRPRWRAVRRALIGQGFWRTTGLVALVRMAPAAPFAMTNVVLAGVGVSRGAFLLGTAIGLSPRIALAVFAAHGAAHWREAQTMPQWTWIAGLSATLLVVVVLTWIASRALRRLAAEDAQRDALSP